MKHLYKFLFLFIIINTASIISVAQINLVPNGDFEQFTSCPSNIGEIFKATGWDSYANTPDYMNACGSAGFTIPANAFGYQTPASGNAYAGFLNYMSKIYYPDPNGFREYIGRSLSSPLNIGTKYYVSFKVSLSIESIVPSNGASDKMGVMFSTIPFSISNPAPITNAPPIFSGTIITDSTSWTTIFGSFIPDSTYQYIILGNFFDNDNTDTLIITSDTICSSYYFLDDVCVSTDSAFCANYTSISELKKNNDILVYPNPAIDLLNIDFPTLTETYNLVIFDEIGREVYSQNRIASGNLSINLSDISGSFLIIKFFYKNQFYYYKFLKQ